MNKSGPGTYVRKARSREFFGVIHQLLPLAASAVQINDDVPLDGQADFLSFGRAATFTDGQAKVRFERVPGRYDASAPYFISSLGSGRFPLYYPQPLLIPRGTTYRMWADDREVVAANNNLRVLHIGQKVFDTPFESAKLYTWVEPDRLVADFTAQNPIGALTALGTLQFALQVSSEFDFDISKVVVLSDGPITVDIETTGKALKWFNRSIHSFLLGGSAFNAGELSGQWPFRLPSPVLVPASGVILVTVTDLSNAANRVQIMFDGLKMAPARGMPISDAQVDQMGAA